MSGQQNFDRTTTAIIATYNRANYLGAAVDSLLAQDEPPVQLIVVDDGSDDDTSSVAGRYGKRIEYLRKDNGGKASAINLALRKAHGHWIWIFDDDDLAQPRALNSLLDALMSHPHADFAFGGQVIARESADGNLVDHREVLPTIEADDALLFNVLQGFCFRLQATLIRRNCFAVVGPLDERYLRGQDYELLTRLARRFMAVRIERPMLIWREHTGERGAGRARHPVEDRDKLWAEFDAMLGRDIRTSYELGEFLVPPVRNGSLSAEARAAALFNRGVIMATKGLIPEFIQDLGAAFALMPPDRSLSKEQRALLLKTGCNSRFLARLAIAPMEIGALRALPSGRKARETAVAIARALFYAYRQEPDGTKQRRQYLMCAYRLLLDAGFGAVLSDLTQRSAERIRRIAGSDA